MSSSRPRDFQRSEAKVKIEVRGERAGLYVHEQDQPTLIVNKDGCAGKSAVALWIDRGTVVTSKLWVETLSKHNSK
jgi:hypothetical protein